MPHVVKKLVEKEAWIVTNKELSSGIVICSWKNPPEYNRTDGNQTYDMDVYFYTVDVLNYMFGIDIGKGMRCKCRITYFPNGKGFTLKLVGKPTKPKR